MWWWWWCWCVVVLLEVLEVVVVLEVVLALLGRARAISGRANRLRVLQAAYLTCSTFSHPTPPHPSNPIRTSPL